MIPLITYQDLENVGLPLCDTVFRLNLLYNRSFSNFNNKITLMEAIPFYDIVEVYINIYLRLHTTIFHNSE